MEGLNTHGFSFDLPKGNSSIIKVIGVGGGGNNALKHMYEKGIHGVDFVICNTDAQTLDNNPVSNKVQLGVTITEGLGAGADPEVGEKAAIESIDDIKAALGQNTKMVFITAGMGGGTGTGAAPVIAKVAKEQGILTVAIVTVPFSFEGKRRLEQADLGLEKLRNNVDSLIVINNDKLRQQFGNLGFKQGFSKADEVLTNAAKGMAEVITGYFDVNIDFRDAKSVLQNSGTALMSTGTASGENKAEEAVKKALDSPLLNDNKITGAKNVLLLIRSGAEEATMDEIGLINDYIQREAGNTADIIFGVGSDEELGDSISVLVIATGFAKENRKYSGPTEKVRIALDANLDQKSSYKESPFKSRSEIEDENSVDQGDSQNMFRLTDAEEDQPTLSFSEKFEKKTIRNERTVQTLQKDEEMEENPLQYETNPSEKVDLFSYEEVDETDLEAESFTFQISNEAKEETPSLFAEEKPFEFSFAVNEPLENKPSSEITEKPLEMSAGIVDSTKDDHTISNAYAPKIEITTEPNVEKPQNTVAEEEVGVIHKEEVEEFTFISKIAPSEDEKVMERRNKLKEFNSRYQVTDTEDDFEKVPAFKRKNIAIDGMNASEQRLPTFLTENEDGQMQVRENRFLNKDVD